MRISDWSSDVCSADLVRGGITIEKLAGMKPVFRKDGLVTAGNASGLNDGAAALVLAEAGKAAALGLKPLARLVAYSHTGVDPAYMGIRSEEHTSGLQSLMRLSYAVFGL